MSQGIVTQIPANVMATVIGPSIAYEVLVSGGRLATMRMPSTFGPVNILIGGEMNSFFTHVKSTCLVSG